MYQLCRHILPAGRRCTQPAVGGTVYCRHHQIIQRTKQASVLPARFAHLHRPLPFLFPEDRAAITANLFLVMRALDDRRISAQTAGVYNRLLRAAEQNLKPGPLHETPGEQKSAQPTTRRNHKDSWDDEEETTIDNTVQQVIITSEGEEIAPPVDVWEDSEEQQHNETCPCLECARQYRQAASERHHPQCTCAACADKNNTTPAQPNPAKDDLVIPTEISESNQAGESAPATPQFMPSYEPATEEPEPAALQLMPSYQPKPTKEDDDWIASIPGRIAKRGYVFDKIDELYSNDRTYPDRVKEALDAIVEAELVEDRRKAEAKTS